MKACSNCGFEHRGLCAPKPVKAQIVNEISRLEFEQFKYPDDAVARDRVLEIRELAIAQLGDDVYYTGGAHRDRIGRDYVVPRDMNFGYETGMFRMWAPRTDEDEALALAVEPFLDELSPGERALLRLYFDAGESHQEIASRLGTSRQNVSQRLNRIYDRLRERMIGEFGRGEEEEDD